MITTELLEVLQIPPTSSEPDMGTVDPLTESELASIARYNEETGLLEDCLDGFMGGPTAGNVFPGAATDYGVPAAEYIKTCFGWLNEWFEAIDTLDSELRDGNGHLSNAAGRVLEHEIGKLLHARDLVRVDALRYLVGDAGPTPVIEGGLVSLSNGYVSCGH